MIFTVLVISIGIFVGSIGASVSVMIVVMSVAACTVVAASCGYSRVRKVVGTVVLRLQWVGLLSSFVFRVFSSAFRPYRMKIDSFAV